jgi:protein SCO1
MSSNPYRTGCIAAIIVAAAFCASCRKASNHSDSPAAKTNLQYFSVTGIVNEIERDGKTIVIKHDTIPDFMAAMTMPFNVKSTNELVGLRRGDKITFRLSVAAEESWIDNIRRTGETAAVPNAPTVSNTPPSISATHPLLDFKFTNEFNQLISFNDFRGRAVAFTLFFTRCPIPEFCPRLSKNFSEASQKLRALPNAPTNWHFLSFTFDPDFDTPEVMRAYGTLYGYDSNHWSFVTGPKDKIAELAQASGVTYTPDGANYNHNFRTLVIDAAGRLQMNFPISGDLSDHIVTEILKAAAVTNR